MVAGCHHPINQGGDLAAYHVEHHHLNAPLLLQVEGDGGLRVERVGIALVKLECLYISPVAFLAVNACVDTNKFLNLPDNRY